MTELPYMPCHVHDEIARTAHLTNEEMGAFRRLQLAMWRAGGHLKDDPKLLARYARAGKRWGLVAPAIMDMLTVAGGKVSYQPLLELLDLTRNRRRQSVDAINRRWAVQKSGRGGANRRFSGPQIGEQQRPLSAAKPLKTNEPGHTDVSVPYVRHPYNQNQNHLERDSIRSRDAAAEQDLFEEALAVLVDRGGKTALQARPILHRWLNQAHADMHPVASAIARADEHGLRGKNFIEVIDQTMDAIEAERTKGPRLPFPPAAIK